MIFAYLLFFGLAAGLAALPLVPAIREWRRPTDTAPLRVVQRSEVDVRYLANRFREWVRVHLGEALAAGRRTGAGQSGQAGADRYRVVPVSSGPFGATADERASLLEAVVAACGDLTLPDHVTAAKELYAQGSVGGGTGGVYRAILAAGDVVLGPESRTLRWVHADGSVRFGPDGRAYGRVSADRVITLGPGCRFERLGAPRIEFGVVESVAARPADRLLPRLEPEQAGPGTIVESGAGRWLVKGDLEIPPDVLVEGDLVVTGTCRLGRGVILAGSAKSHEDLVLEDGAEVRGAVVGQREVRVAAGCRIAGPVIAERAVQLAGGTVVGAPERPATVSGPDVTVATGAVVFGAVRAHRNGAVVEPGGAPGAGTEVAG